MRLVLSLKIASLTLASDDLILTSGLFLAVYSQASVKLGIHQSYEGEGGNNYLFPSPSSSSPS